MLVLQMSPASKVPVERATFFAIASAARLIRARSFSRPTILSLARWA
jgi:hypothetical protein